MYYPVLQRTTPVLLWNVIYNARSKQSEPRTSPTTAPATQSESHAWSMSHMKRHLQCAKQQEPPCNFTKYCACHTKWIASVIHITYETSFTMRGASKVNLEPHQLLRLPRKMNLMNDPRHIWTIISNARSELSRRLCAPSTAPATKSLSSRSQVKVPEVLPPIERRFEDNPKISEHKIVISHPPLRRPDSSHLRDAFSMEKYNASRSGYLPKCHEVLRLPRKVTLHLHQILRLPQKVTLHLHQILRLPRNL